MPIQAKQAHTLFLAQETDTDQGDVWDSATQRIVTNILPLVMLILIGSCTRNMKLLGYMLAALQLIASIPRAYRRIRKLPLDWAVVAAAVYIFTIGLASGAYYYGVAIFTYPYIASLLYMAMSAIDTVIDACTGSVDIANILPATVPAFLYFLFWKSIIPDGYDDCQHKFAPFVVIGALLELLATLASTGCRNIKLRKDTEERSRLSMCLVGLAGIVGIIACWRAMPLLHEIYKANKDEYNIIETLPNGIRLTESPYYWGIALGSDGRTYDLDSNHEIWTPSDPPSSLFSF